MQRAIIAGTGSGKTIAGTVEDICWAKHYPGSVGYIFAPSYPMIKRNLIPTFEKILGKPLESNPDISVFSKGDMRLEWRNGSIQWFVSLEDPERAEGPNVDYAHLDEARLVRNFWTAWLVIIRRLRGSGLSTVPLEPSVWITTTPDYPNSDLFKTIEDPHTKSAESQIYRASLFDNITLSPKFIAEIVRTHSGGLAERFIYGRFATVGGGSMPFDSSKHVFSLPPQHLRFIQYGLDFGWSNPTAAIAIGFDGDGRAYALDEIYKTQMRTDELISELQEWYNTYGKGEIFCDPSSPATIDELYRSGLHAVGYSHKRVDGIRELGSRFLPATDQKPRLFISKVCVNLISELLEYKEDISERNQRDHAVDALRYGMPLTPQSEVGGRRVVVQ